MRAFVQRYLEPADRLGEVLFGLIMSLGFTGAVRLGMEEPDNRALFVSILGCNLAWGIVDGVMYVMIALFERGRQGRLIRSVVASPSEDEALRRIGEEFDDRLDGLSTDEERGRLYRQVMQFARQATRERAHLRSADLLGGVAVAVLILVATGPVLIPFLLFHDPEVAVRLSNLVAVALLFLVGVWWGRVVGVSPLGVGAGVAAVGIIMVIVTIALGG